MCYKAAVCDVIIHYIMVTTIYSAHSHTTTAWRHCTVYMPISYISWCNTLISIISLLKVVVLILLILLNMNPLCVHTRTHTRTHAHAHTHTHTHSYLLITLYESLQGHVSQKVTCNQLHKRAERLAHFIQEKVRFNSGDHIALIYPPGELTLPHIANIS